MIQEVSPYPLVIGPFVGPIKVAGHEHERHVIPVRVNVVVNPILVLLPTVVVSELAEAERNLIDDSPQGCF
jgi:hypothetical protein